MARPKIITQIQTNRLGQIESKPDGTTLLAIGVPSGLSDIDYDGMVVTSVKDLEDNYDVNLAWDDTNNVFLYNHVVDFFQKGGGSALHILPILNTATASQIFTVGNANYVKISDYITSQAGDIKILAVCTNSDTLTTELFDNDDIVLAIPKAQALVDFHVDAQRPFIAILENRNFNLTATQASDLRNLGEYSSVVVMNSRDQDRVSVGVPLSSQYAAVGFLAGLIASRGVHESIGKVELGDVGFVSSAFSDGRLISQKGGVLSDGELDALYTKGYIFAYKIPNKAGFFFGQDWTCAPVTNDLHKISRTRVIYKAMTICYVSLLPFIEKDFTLSNEGTLLPVDEQFIATTIDSNIRGQMEASISNLKVSVSSVDFVNTSTINVSLDIQPKGIASTINVIIGYVKSI